MYGLVAFLESSLLLAFSLGIYFKKKEDSEFVKCNSINDIPKKPYLIKIILQDGELLITPKKIDNNSFTE